jgi:hypothetical protein
MIALYVAFSWLDFLQHFHDCTICNIFMIVLCIFMIRLHTCTIFMIGLLYLQHFYDCPMCSIFMIWQRAAFSWLAYLQHFHDCPMWNIFMIGLLAAFSWFDYLQHCHNWTTCSIFMTVLFAIFSWWTICSIFIIELKCTCSIFVLN